MPRNTLTHLHNVLMEQMERLATADDEEVENEMRRMASMANGAAAIDKNMATMITINRMRDEFGDKSRMMLTEGDHEG